MIPLEEVIVALDPQPDVPLANITEENYIVDCLGRKRSPKEILERDEYRADCCGWLCFILVILIFCVGIAAFIIMCIELPIYKEASILFIVSTILSGLIILPLIIVIGIIIICIICDQCNKLI